MKQIASTEAFAQYLHEQLVTLKGQGKRTVKLVDTDEVNTYRLELFVAGKNFLGEPDNYSDISMSPQVRATLPFNAEEMTEEDARLWINTQ